MALSASIAAYNDCYNHFDRARESPKGIRILFEDKKQAGLLRMRMNQARVLERRESMRIYDRIDPKYGKSENDFLRVCLREAAEDGHWWVYIEPWGQDNLTVEEIE